MSTPELIDQEALAEALCLLVLHKDPTTVPTTGPCDEHIRTAELIFEVSRIINTFVEES